MTDTPKQLPRGFYVSVLASKTTSTSAFTFDPKSGAVSLLDGSGNPIPLEARAAGIALIEPVSKKLRVQSAVPVSGAPMLNPFRALAQFETVIAVDACPVRGHEGRHIIAMVQVHIGQEKSVLRPALLLDVHGVPAEVNGERLGWRFAASEVMNTKGYQPGERVAIITDAHFGEHDAINRREKEILPGWPLPPGFTLTYARDKSPSDSLVQEALRRCDRLGRDFARSCQRGLVRPPNYAPRDPFFAAFSRWIPSPDGRGWVLTERLRSGN